METTIMGSIGTIQGYLGLYRGHIGIMEKKIETTVMGLIWQFPKTRGL